MELKKQIYHPKFVQLVKDHLVGEKNGKIIGIMSNTAVKDVELVRCFSSLV
tara:strand:- start:22 stop:174 length:153 start_codon:yes stop_codon:yes gene_type:complete